MTPRFERPPDHGAGPNR
ncbi:hypothetical protein AVEN_222049-1, partial [Araneus ventricosus]